MRIDAAAIADNSIRFLFFMSIISLTIIISYVYYAFFFELVNRIGEKFRIKTQIISIFLIN